MNEIIDKIAKLLEERVPNETWQPKVLAKEIYEKVRRETIKEVVEFAEGFFCWDEEGFVRTLKDHYEDELEELRNEN